MSSNPQCTLSLQALHEVLAVLADVFCEQVCKKCNWSASTFYFHLHHPGHLTEKEKRKLAKTMRRLLVNTLAETPQITE